MPSSSPRATSTLLLNPAAGSSSPHSTGAAGQHHPQFPSYAPSRLHSNLLNPAVAQWVLMFFILALVIYFLHEQVSLAFQNEAAASIATARMDQIPSNAATTPRDRKDWVPWSLKLSAIAADIDRVGSSTDLVMVGDSITAGWLEAGAPVLASTPWMQALKPLHLAVGGDQTSHILWRLHPSFGAQLSRVNPRARVVVLLAGTNNSRWGVPALHTLWGLRAIVLQILAHFDPGVQILVLGVLPRADWIKPFRLNQSLNRQLHSALHNTAQGVFVYESEFTRRFMEGGSEVGYELEHLPRINSTLFHADKLHLSPAGYEVWAQVLEPIVKKHQAIAAAATAASRPPSAAAPVPSSPPAASISNRNP